MKAQRIETLDWLRGLMAISIMIYHLTYWILTPLDASNLLGRLGIYGVSIFFILSGLSMAIVYNNYIKSFKTSIKFYIRRIFRIWPLLWLVTSLIILSPVLSNQTYSLKLIFLNFTTLFGFISPTKYIATGAWSIGNEMVYYALTPIILAAFNYKLWLGNFLFIITLFIGLLFAFIFLHSDKIFAEQWAVYVNPFNNLFLYIGGISIYYNLKQSSINTLALSFVLLISILSFCFLPFSGNQIILVTGIGRIIFVILSFTIVISFYKMKFNKMPQMIKNSLESFGFATYGIYLMHPIIYGYTHNLIHNTFLLFFTVVIVTIIVSIYTFRLFEIKLTEIGKKFSNKIN